jgi:hypothetical protein
MGATGLSAGSLALQGFSTLMQSQGTAEADTYQAERLDVAAKYGELKAVQTGGQMTRSLNAALGNIEAVRAAANADPSSPTGAAVIENQEAIGSEQRGITVNSILQQSRQDTADAAYYRDASKRAMLAGEVSAGADIFKGLAGINFSSGASDGTGFSLVRTGGLY